MRKAIKLKIAEAERQATVAPTMEDYDESQEHRKKSEGTINIISFFLEADEYAFEVSEAVEVLRPRQTTEVPWTPEYIKGILSVRGEMVPVLDLKMRLGLGKVNGRPTARILVVAVEDLKAGLLVDRLSGVKEVPARFLEPPGESEPQAAFMKAVIHNGEMVIKLLDAGVLISAEN